jgi:hypothetical protein
VQDLVTPEVVPDHLDIRDAIQDPDLVHTRQDLEELDGMPLPEDHRDHPGDAVTVVVPRTMTEANPFLAQADHRCRIVVATLAAETLRTLPIVVAFLD